MKKQLFLLWILIFPFFGISQYEDVKTSVIPRVEIAKKGVGEFIIKDSIFIYSSQENEENTEYLDFLICGDESAYPRNRSRNGHKSPH